MVDEIKAWLKQTNRDRTWLGEQTGVTKRSVDNWLSAGQPIPEAKQFLIRRLMADDEAAEQRQAQQRLPQNQIFSLEVTLAQHRRYAEAARKRQKTVEQWSIEELDAAAEAWEQDPTSLRQYLRTDESIDDTSKLNDG
jgi:hypothetical protein